MQQQKVQRFVPVVRFEGYGWGRTQAKTPSPLSNDPHLKTSPIFQFQKLLKQKRGGSSGGFPHVEKSGQQVDPDFTHNRQVSIEGRFEFVLRT